MSDTKREYVGWLSQCLFDEPAAFKNRANEAMACLLAERDAARAEVDRLTAALADAERGWQPISTAPKDRLILVWDGEHTIATWIDGEWQPCLEDQQPTHWMPLPPLPEPPREEG